MYRGELFDMLGCCFICVDMDRNPPTIFFEDEVAALAAPHQRMLVGKFGRAPNLSMIHQF